MAERDEQALLHDGCGGANIAPLRCTRRGRRRTAPPASTPPSAGGVNATIAVVTMMMIASRLLQPSSRIGLQIRQRPGVISLSS
jgi:hypothetical protein